MNPREKKASGEGTGVSGPAAASVESGRASAEAAEPSREDIARRAHEIYLARGADDGSADDDWLRAEQELRQAIRAGPPGDRSS